MDYISTRGMGNRVRSAEAIARGLAADGGLYVPDRFPALSLEEIGAFAGMDYAALAARIAALYLTDFPEDLLRSATQSAYADGRFAENLVAPISMLDAGLYILELWHGPTCAFKDVALQLLPYLMTYAASGCSGVEETVILVATSGDTGKAALEGFQDAPGIRMMVFYPEDGVSPVQKLQMTTQQGQNLCVMAVRGNFDDAQSGVKAIFSDRELARELKCKGIRLSSANSINFGRLLPQIVYYFSAYGNLLAHGKIALGDRVNFVVPTGNFGNILAGYYATRMGLPVGRLICASNQNNVLTDFFATGVYDANRPFYTTISPSMDILLSSNLERLLFELYDRDATRTALLMESLRRTGRYGTDHAAKPELFWAGYCSEEMTRYTIKSVFERYSYLVDPHTAVACGVYQDYRLATGDTNPTVVLSTASPYKFAQSVLEALAGTRQPDGFAALEELNALTKTDIPVQLAGLRGKAVRFTESTDPSRMKTELLAFLKRANKTGGANASC
jgi:threonine synthase